MIKLIASDMDGTLLNRQMQVSKTNVDAIKAAQSRGVEFITATGRGIGHAKVALDAVNIQVPMILLNGARIIDETGKTVFAAPIPEEKAFQILDQLEAANIYYEIFTEDHVYSENQAFRMNFFVNQMTEHNPQLTMKNVIANAPGELEKLPIDYVADIRQTVIEQHEKVLKIIAFSIDPTPLDPMAEQLRQLGDLAITSSDPTNLEINHQDAQKGIALAHYAKMRGLDAPEVAACGDNFNDVSMLRFAGTSFAMANAAEPVKSYATHITATNENNGVAQAIELILTQQ